MAFSFPFSYTKQLGPLCAVALCLLAGSAFAEGIDYKTTITETGSWDSNPLMLTTGAKSVYGSALTPKLVLSKKTPTTQLSAEGSVSSNIFSDSSYNSTDVHAKIRLNEKMQLWRFGFNGGGDYDTARTSELTTLGLNIGSIRHTGYSLGSEIAYQPTQRDEIAFSASFLDSSYDSRQLTDYRTYTLSPSWIHNFSQLNQGLISIQAQRYQSFGNSRARIDSIGPSVGWLSSLTPRLSLQLSAGAQASKQVGNTTTNKGWQWNNIFSGELSYKGDQDTTTLSATRSRQPYANGTESLLTTFSIRERHQINKLFSVSLRASYQLAKQPPSSGSNLESLTDGSASLTYSLSPEWDLSSSYQYRYETLTGNDDTATQSVARLTLSFKPNWGGF